jgi:hypothetical protein
MALRRRLGVLVGFAALATSLAHAAPPESVGADSRAQVLGALRALEPAFVGKTRSVQASNPGSIEHAIASYAPPRPWPVDEGRLPPRSTASTPTCKPDMVMVSGRFCVDKYEGSLVEQLADGTMRPHSPYHTPAPQDGIVYVARSVAGVVPQGYISAAQAQSACKAAGKRLCHPVEWRAACGGSEGFTYPYGATRTAGRCHDSGATPMLTYHADTMKRGWGLTELNDARNNQLEGSLAKTGAFPECVNDFGAYDMVGNLHEWTADPNGTFQGGYWLDTSQHGDGCAYRTIAHGFEYHDYSTGFRCCGDVTTATN